MKKRTKSGHETVMEERKEERPGDRTLWRVYRRQADGSISGNAEDRYQPDIIEFDRLFGDLLAAWLIYRREKDWFFRGRLKP